MIIVINNIFYIIQKENYFVLVLVLNLKIYFFIMKNLIK